MSTDSRFTHKVWQEEELSKMVQGGVPFPMLSDAGGRIGSVYGIYDEGAGVDIRGRFLIDPDGVIQALEIDPKEVTAVVLSHIHGDHVGGLSGFLKENSNVTVYVPTSFSQKFKDEIRSADAKLEEIRESKKLIDDVYTTGELGNGIIEQSLIVKTESGLAVITGCAHPGIVKIVETAKQLVKGDVLLVMGGFHLGGKSEREIKDIITSFKRLSVRHVGPCHCSGDKARRLFKEAYGPSFLQVGVGRIITIKDSVE